MPKRGEKYKKTPATINGICAGIALGQSPENAARACGVSRSTYCRWLADDDEFRELVETAKAQRINVWLQVIEDAMADHWQAAAWKLERTAPKEYGRRVAMQVTDSDGNPLDPNEIRVRINARLTAIAESGEESEIPGELDE